MKIDVHNHAVTNEALGLLKNDRVYGARIEGGVWSGDGHVSFKVEPPFLEPDAKIAELEAKGIEGAVVSPAPPLFYTEVGEGPAEAIARATNEGLAAFARAVPERLRWMALVPIAYPERAVEVLEDAARAGAVGVEVPTSVKGRRLDGPEFEPFWAAAERLGLPVLPHPHDNEPHRALGDFYLQNVIGNLLETTIMIERLICVGLLDRHPGLKILLVHGGGYYPYQAGRLKHARTVRPELASAPEDPWRYRGQILSDTITHDGAALRYLVERMGVENVYLGTDLPYDMAPHEPVRAIEEALGAETARQVMEANPAKLFGFGD